jgi:hypothetical protein
MRGKKTLVRILDPTNHGLWEILSRNWPRTWNPSTVTRIWLGFHTGLQTGSFPSAGKPLGIASHTSPTSWMCTGREWPSPHDCTSSVWDELVVFIPVIEAPTVRKVELKQNLLALQQSIVFSPYTLLTELPHFFTHLLPCSICNGKTYIFSWLNFSN